MKIAFIGAGSTMFAKNLFGDLMLLPAFDGFTASLHDIDPVRLQESTLLVERLATLFGKKVKVESSLDRRKALAGADYVINAIQVGGYRPCTVTDFEVPKKYGLRQTIGDTLGIGGIFRALRTIPVLEGIAHDMQEVCPDAYFLNYVNPMAILTAYMLTQTGIRTVGLCHSVQVCVKELLTPIGMADKIPGHIEKIAGINHMAWLLELRDREGNDLYPEVKRRCAMPETYDCGADLVRRDMMYRFGYYVTESSEHTAEYHPYYIKSAYPELIDRYRIPLDEYPRRCEQQIADWEKQRDELLGGKLSHTLSREYGAHIIAALETGEPYEFNGNVMNTGLIPNLPHGACVEVPVLADGGGFHPCYGGDLPEQCAALNRTNINVQLLTLRAALSKKREDVYMAAYLDPHTRAELSLDDIRSLCDDLFEAHGDWLPAYH